MTRLFNSKTVFAAVIGMALGISAAGSAFAQSMDAKSQASFDTVMAFMGAMGKGDVDAMSALMADDMVWQNEGDSALPWIGPWEGKEEIFKFLPVFGENFQTTAWENTDAFALGDTVAVFGNMNGITKKSGNDIGGFTFALRAKVSDGKVVLWNWFEDSYAVSQAYHGEAIDADDKTTVQVFYDFLSNPGSQFHAKAFMGATADGWESVGNYSGKNKSADGFVGQLGGVAKLIPDLNWAVQDMHQSGNTVVVRSRATGTPAGPLFGVDGQGRGFDILTIDVHELKGSKIARTYHVEDWAGALKQLSGR